MLISKFIIFTLEQKSMLGLADILEMNICNKSNLEISTLVKNSRQVFAHKYFNS